MNVYILKRYRYGEWDCIVSVHVSLADAETRKSRIVAAGGDKDEFFIEKFEVDAPEAVSCCRNGQGNWLVSDGQGGAVCACCGIGHAAKEPDALYRIPITNSWYAGPKSAFDAGYDQIDWKKK